MAGPSSNQVPSVWQGVAWAMEPGARGGGTSRTRLVWRAFVAALRHGKAMRRWMHVVAEQHARGVIRDVPGEYLRAVRPYVNGHTSFSARVLQLIEHVDWFEAAVHPAAFERIAAGQALVLAELPAPQGYQYLRLLLGRTAPHSPEGELLLTLTLQRAPDVQNNPQPVDVAALGFSRFRVEGMPCLVIGGVRGQRNQVLRLSSVEVARALSGWKPPVLMVCVAQELARHWDLKLVGLNPSAHRLHGWSYRWSRRHRETMQRIYASYDALWDHFEAMKGPPGWMALPLDSDAKLAATALSPERRVRQIQRADYWIRVRALLRNQFRGLLVRPSPDSEMNRVTQSIVSDALEDEDSRRGEDMVPSRIFETEPGALT